MSKAKADARVIQRSTPNGGFEARPPTKLIPSLACALPDLLGDKVSWIKQVQPTTTECYRLGFTNTLKTAGSLYLAPSNATTRVPGFSNGLVSFVGGNLNVPFTNVVLLTNNNLVINKSTNKLTMSVVVANGMFSGTVAVPGTRTSDVLKGAVLQDESEGWGYFLGTNQSGRVQSWRE